MIRGFFWCFSLLLAVALAFPSDLAAAGKATSYDQDQIRPKQQTKSGSGTQTKPKTTTSGSRISQDLQIDAYKQGSQYYQEQQGILKQGTPPGTGVGGGGSYKPPTHK